MKSLILLFLSTVRIIMVGVPNAIIFSTWDFTAFVVAVNISKRWF